MNQADILKQVADTAYNVGFGAKKHFATYDIVEKAPGWIGFISIGFGIFALFIDVLATKHMSALLIVLGISGLLINCYSGSKLDYEQKGVYLTQLFNELKTLYFSIKSSKKTEFSEDKLKLSEIESKYYTNCVSKQILFSDWYAHYKFFWQHQIDWVDEQKHFKFWRDRIPLSFMVFCILLVVSFFAILVWTILL
ncbi:MAG TPA: hypothetical protein DF296_00870 [Candidatus Margulisbacteria bacterium]|nr:MAG: hypothetical protein A2X43_07190 [Candidatus Margulisbacteria bacterium GWD2_39_127]HAR63369.1 hypothetical protein [Candidatus Margulisiibacteriota bacterium]HCT83734.1 hypothetical protein [Candidatus Margulisiibacteriota bacterium]